VASVPMLVITGPVGVGKTTVAVTASGLLDRAGTAHALVDMDWLRWCHPSPDHDPFHIALGLRNLAAVWANCRAAGAERLLLVDIVESGEDLAGYRAAVPGADIVVARLRASLPTIMSRLEGREVGADLEWHRRRAAELSGIMERNRIGDLIVDTEEKTVADLAGELLTRAGWIVLAEANDRP
jgi:energy-coupling factor transporter ATP-binding protein EcfA2